MKKGLLIVLVQIILIMIGSSMFGQIIHTLPHQENFDGVTPLNLPPAWYGIKQASYPYSSITTYNADTYAFSRPNLLRMLNTSDVDEELILVAPPLADTIQVNETRVRFWARGQESNYSLSIGVVLYHWDYSTFTEITTVDLINHFSEYTVDLTSYQGEGKYIAFKHGLGGYNRIILMDNIIISKITTCDLGAAAIHGNTMPLAGSPSTYIVDVKNWGSEPQNNYTVKLFNVEGVELASVQGLPVEPNDTVQLAVPWSPATGDNQIIYGKIVLANDTDPSNNNSHSMHILVATMANQLITVGEGGYESQMPLSMSKRNSLFECLYYPDELGQIPGRIMGITFYSNFISELPNMPVSVWIGTSPYNDLSTGWIPSTELTPVFNACISFHSGEHAISIPFDTPYEFNQNQNLVIMIQRPIDIQSYDLEDKFIAQDDTLHYGRSRFIANQTIIYDPANPPHGSYPITLGTAYPQTSFLIIPSGTGTLYGYVRNSNGQAIDGAVVTVDNYSTTTNNSGMYIMNLPSGYYSLLCSAAGYQNASFNLVCLLPNQERLLNIDMISTANEDELSPVIATGLKGNSPNPFNPETVITYSIKDACPVRLEIYNLKGQKVRSLVNATQEAGNYRMVFDGKDDDKRPLASGIYFYRLQAGAYSSTRKMMLLK